MRGLLYAMLLAGGVASLPRIGRVGLLPMTEMLDVWIILLVAIFLVRGKIRTTPALLLLSLFLLTRVVGLLATESPLWDFAQAYRWVLYLIAYAIAVGRSWGPIQPLKVVLFLLIGMATLKAGLTLVIIGPGERPGLLLENNFELALYTGAVALLYRHIAPRWRFWAIALVGLLVILAGSRSGAFAFLALIIYALSQLRFTTTSRAVLGAYVLPIAVAIPAWIFIERLPTARAIDRFNFFEVFQREVAGWGPLEWLFGTAPITPLSHAGCAQLKFYETLFSSTGDGTCYSVILHAFMMRVVFDAGIVGLLVAFGTAWWAMRVSGVRTALTLTLLAIAVANSLSVSGLNNPYVALPILLAIMTASATPAAASSVPESATAHPIRHQRRSQRFAQTAE